MRAGWNAELVKSCAAAIRRAAHRAAEDFGLPHDQTVSLPMYRYWPRASEMSADALAAALLPPLYTHLAEKELFLVVPRALDDEKPQRRGLRRLDDGLVCPPSIDGRLGDFVRQHFSAFDMPPPVAEQLLASAPRGMRSLSAAEVRGYVKRKLGDAKKRDKRLASRAWAPLHSANFALDLLAYCASDLHGGAADVAASPLASALSRSSLAAFASASSSTRPRYHELHELRLLPLASGGLAPLGSGDYVVAGAAQQALLPHLAPQFVSAARAQTTPARASLPRLD